MLLSGSFELFGVKRIFIFAIAMLWIAAFLLYDFSHYLMWGLVHELDIPSNNFAFWALSISFTLVLASIFITYPIRRIASQPLDGLADFSSSLRDFAKAISLAIFATWIIFTLDSLGKFYLQGTLSEIVDRGQFGWFLFINGIYLIVSELLGNLIGTPTFVYLKSRGALSPFTIVAGESGEGTDRGPKPLPGTRRLAY